MSNTNIINSTIADNLLIQCFNKKFFQIQGIYHRVCQVTNKIIAKKINMVCFNDLENMSIHSIKFENFLKYETAYNNKSKMTEQEYELITAYIYMIQTNLRKHLEYIYNPSIGMRINHSVSIEYIKNKRLF